MNRASDRLDLESIATVVRRLHAEDVRALRATGRALPHIARLARLAHASLLAGGRLIYVGAGTSGRLGAMDAAECPPTFGSDPRQVTAVLAGGPKALSRAVEGAEDDARAGAGAMGRLRLRRRDLVCGISASAQTPFVLGALEAARRAGSTTALISSNPKARVPVTVRVILDTGPELIAGSTRLKAGTATKSALNALSTAVMVALGHVYRGRMIDLVPTNAKLRARAERTVRELAEVSPAQAKLLLAAAGRPSVALAMQFTGLPRQRAELALEAAGLRVLERARRHR